MPDHSPAPIRRKRKLSRHGETSPTPALQPSGLSGGIAMDTPENILAMQRMIGNQRVQRLLAASGDTTGKLRRDGTGTKDKGEGTKVDNRKEVKPAPSPWDSAELQTNPDLVPKDTGMKWVVKARASVSEPDKPLALSDLSYPQNTIATDNIGSGMETYATIAAGKPFWQTATLPDAIPADLTGSRSFRVDQNVVPGSRQSLKDGTIVYVFKMSDGTDCYTSGENATDKSVDFWTLKFGSSVYKVAKTNVEQKSAGFTQVTTPLWDEKGPKPEDIKQTNLGDCYFQAALIEVAQNNPDYIKNYLMTDQGGTVTVQYWYKSGKKYEPDFIKMDKSIATNAAGRSLYNDGALWVKMLQKAFAIFAGQHGQYGELLKPPDAKGYAPLDGGFSYMTYAMLYGNTQIKADRESVNFDEDDPNDLSNNSTLIEMLLQKQDPEKYMPKGQVLNLTTSVSADEHMKRLQNVLPKVIKSLKKGGASFDAERLTLIELQKTVKKARSDWNKKGSDDPTPESVNDLSKAVQLIIDGNFGKVTVGNNKNIASIQTLFELLYDLKNVGTDNSPGSRFVYSGHAYAILGAEFRDKKGDILLWDSDLKKARKQIVKFADASQSKVTLRNPHHTNSPTANVPATAGPDEGKFTLTLEQYIRNFGAIDYAKVKKF